MSTVLTAIPQPRKSCYKHTKRMAYCADCNTRQPVGQDGADTNRPAMAN